MDEVAEIPLQLQGKLLRVLEEREFYRVGGVKKIKADVRIICATNLPLEKQVAGGKFRRDLFFRLNVAQLLLPPLRERKAEIQPLALLFLRDFARRKGRRFASIQPETAALLKAYSWPGNIRELRNVIDFATFAYDDAELKPAHVAGQLLRGNGGQGQAAQQADGAIALPLPPGGYPLKRYTEDVVAAVLQAHNGNQAATARYLGITARALAYRLGQPRTRQEEKH